MAIDGRVRCRAAPPLPFKSKRPVSLHLEWGDYYRLYMITMQRGTSMQETLRQLIRETPVKGEDP